MSVMNFGPRILKANGFAARAISITVAALTLDGTYEGRTMLLNRSAGSALTLPDATGSGRRYRAVVATASNANTFLAPASNSFVGSLTINNTGDSSAATADVYPAAAGNNTISPTTAGGGGAVGDIIEFEDIADNVWRVSGQFGVALDPVTPFSTV